MFPVLNSLFYQRITNYLLSWKHTLKLISHPFNELRIPFGGLFFKLPGKLRNWQSGSHPCFTLYINNWPEARLRNSSPRKSWWSDRTFFQGLWRLSWRGLNWKKISRRNRFLDMLDPVIIHGYNRVFWPVDWFAQPDLVKTLKYFSRMERMYPLDGQEQPKNFENFDFGIDLKSTQWSRQHCVLQATD